MTEDEIVRPSPSLWRDLWRNLRSGLRVACFLSANRAGFAVDWTQVVLLILLSLLTALGQEMAHVGLAGELHLNALPFTLFFVLAVMVAAWAMAAIAGRTAQTLALIVAILSAGLWIDLAITGVELLVDGAPRGLRGWLSWAIYYVYAGWFVLAAAVGGARMLAPSAARGLAMAAAGAVIVGYALFGVYHYDQLWSERRTPVASGGPRYEAVASEDMLYLQPRLLEGQLGALWPRREGRPNLYLVSVAGYADQDVFMREVNSVDALFAERFGTRGRSVKLVNNRATVRELPLATRTSLSWTLARLGKIMNSDEDVLFLFLTSHGTQNNFSLEFPPLQLADLSAAELKLMLDESGIRNRVIVVSSCYSGSFVEALRDDHTLVMTASARDRNSFGCSNEADFTYFGKAYFDEALRGTDSFTEAFDRALPAIAAREKKDDYTPSQPQRYMGKAIGARLAALHEATARETAPVPPVAAATPPLDPYTRFGRLWQPEGIEHEYYAECRQSMELSSPSVYWRRDPAAFGGVTPASPQWARMDAAWVRYVDAVCKSVSDRAFYEGAWTNGLRNLLGENDMAAVLAFLETPAGKRFLAAEHAISRSAFRELSERQSAAAALGTSDYEQAFGMSGQPAVGTAKREEKGLKSEK